MYPVITTTLDVQRMQRLDEAVGQLVPSQLEVDDGGVGRLLTSCGPGVVATGPRTSATLSAGARLP